MLLTMLEEEKQQLEDEKAQEEKRNLKREIAESLPKFLINLIVVVAIVLFYWFVSLTPWFSGALDVYPILDISTPIWTVILTGYSLLRAGIILVVVFFGVETVKEFAKLADALIDFVISRLPGMRSTDRATVRRIPLDLIFLLFTLVVFILVQPIFDPAFFPIAILQPYFQIFAVSLVLFFVLTFMYDIAKSIQKSAKRGIDDFAEGVADRFSKRASASKAEKD
jgi:hypothetical protein